MQKGKYGIPLQLYGIVAFALVILNQTILLLVLSLFVVLAEKDDQTSRTVLEALALIFTANIAYLILSVFITLSGIFTFLLPLTGAVYSLAVMAVSIISSGIAILGIIKAAKDEEPNFIYLRDLANSMLMFIDRF